MTRVSRASDHERGWQVALLVASVLLAVRIGTTPEWLWVDLDVYVAGGRALLEGRPLYDVEVAGLPFTYPPFAAVLFIPLAVLPTEVTRFLVTGISVAALVWVTWLVGRRVGMTALPTIVVLISALGAEPVVRNLILGQVNIVLMLLVVIDLLVLPPRWRGVLIGVATGVKLVPGAFVLLYVLRRDLASVVRAAAVVAATVLVGWVQPSSARNFWSGGMWDLGVGDTIVRADNQSLAGIAMRLAGGQNIPLAVQLGVAGGALMIGMWCAGRVAAHPWAGPLQLGIMSIAALLASPVSWTHHWIWIVPVTMVLIAVRAWALVGIVTAVFWLGLVWLSVPANGIVSREWDSQVLASAYVVLGVAAMFAMTRHGSRADVRDG